MKPIPVEKYPLYYQTDKHGWISTSLVKPPKNVSVFVYIPEEDDHITTGMWDVSEKWVLLDEYRTPSSQVTKWRPILFELPEDRSFKPTHVEQTIDMLNDQSVQNMRMEIARLRRQLSEVIESTNITPAL